MTGFYEAVRRYILQSVSTTFQTLPKASLSQSLKSDGTTLDNLVTQSIMHMHGSEVHLMPSKLDVTCQVRRLQLLLLQIADKIAGDGWNIGPDNVIRFPKRRVQQAQPQAAKPSVQFEKLLPVLKLAA